MRKGLARLTELLFLFNRKRQTRKGTPTTCKPPVTEGKGKQGELRGGIVHRARLRVKANMDRCMRPVQSARNGDNKETNIFRAQANQEATLETYARKRTNQ